MNIQVNKYQTEITDELLNSLPQEASDQLLDFINNVPFIRTLIDPKRGYAKDRPRDYLFSALLSSEMLFYPIVSDNNIEAIIYPSVQKKKFGQNFAIRNDLIFERYNLVGVETRFILDEYENLDPASDEVTTDQLIGSFGTTAFDFDSGKILYNEKVDELFKLFRDLQTGEGKQVRYNHPNTPKNIAFNLTPSSHHDKVGEIKKKPNLGRNHRIDVVYQDGTRKDRIKYKTVLSDIESGKCSITKYYQT